MKIIHTADWHIGQTFFGYDRFQEHQYFLDWLTDQITTQQIDVLLISGDIFDVANPSILSVPTPGNRTKSGLTNHPDCRKS